MENRIKLDELIHDEILLEYEKIKETTKKDDFNFIRANHALRKGVTIGASFPYSFFCQGEDFDVS